MKKLSIFVFFLGSLAFAKEKSIDKPKDFFEKEKLQKELNLDQEQRKKLGEIHRDFQGRREKIHQELKPLRESLEKELEKDTPDREKVRELWQQIHAKKLDLHILRLDERLAIEDLLTQEQKAKWRGIFKKMGKKHKVEKEKEEE